LVLQEGKEDIEDFLWIGEIGGAIKDRGGIDIGIVRVIRHFGYFGNIFGREGLDKEGLVIEGEGELEFGYLGIFNFSGEVIAAMSAIVPGGCWESCRGKGCITDWAIHDRIL
jgi:hypothetical protein